VDIDDLGTPALLIDDEAMQHNLETMAAALPGARCRPHVKAHKCTALAQRQRDAGHPGFTCATPRELVGMAHAGLTEDLLLANEVVSAPRLAGLAALDARVTVAVDSEATIVAAADAGIREALIDVNVGMPRCGCAPEDAGRLADLARGRGLEVRGVMGYEGHVVAIADRSERARQTETAMAMLATAHDLAGGEIVSAGGTGTYDLNTLATEIQAGSYVLMDGAYGELDLPFRRALSVLATVISVSSDHAVADCGLKALAMDHGDPTIDGATVWFCSDEHITFSMNDGSPPAIGDRIRVWPAHIDPTIAKHELLHLVSEEEILATWPVDLRGW